MVVHRVKVTPVPAGVFCRTPNAVGRMPNDSEVWRLGLGK